MATEQTFKTIITVMDKVTAPLAAISRKLAALSAPVRKLGATIGEIGEASGLKKLSEAARGAGEHFEKMGHRVEGLLGPLAALGAAASVGGLIEMARHASEFGEQLYLASQKTGIGASQLAAYHFAAQKAGVDVEAFDKGMAKLNETVAQAVSGKSQAALVMFGQLGIKLRDTRGHFRSAAGLMPEIADRVTKMHDPIQRAALVAQAFGQRMGPALLPLLMKGRDGVEEARREFERYHGGLDDGGKAAFEFGEKQKLLTLAVSGMSDAIGGKLFPVLTPMLQKMSDWLADNRELVATRVADVVRQLAAALGRVDWTAMIEGASRFVLGAADLLEKIGGIKTLALGVAVWFTAPMIAAFATISAAMLTTPFGWMLASIAALAAAIAGLYKVWQHWDEIKDGLAKVAQTPIQADDIQIDPASGTVTSAGAAGLPPLFGGATGHGDSAGAEYKLSINIANLPPGSTVRSETIGAAAPPRLDVGYAWAGYGGDQ